jgi:hypothetical protein
MNDVASSPGAVEAAVLQYLKEQYLMYPNQRPARVCPGIEQIMEHFGLSKTKCYELAARLESLGLVKWVAKKAIGEFLRIQPAIMQAVIEPINSSSRKISVVFALKPYTLCPVRGFQQVWEAFARYSCGVYMWCIEYESSYLVNYVGKTTSKGGFESRLWTELRDWKNGLYPETVDVDAFKRGRRIVLSSPDPRQVRRQFPDLEQLIRILLAPIPETSDCCPAENEIVYRLRKNEATFQFLSNGDRFTKYPHDPTVEIVPANNPRIIGLTVPVPQSLLRNTGLQ